MQRIDDDARQTRRIELAFLQIELPRAVLLRHQPPLQPVGKPRHHALQMRRAACRDSRAGGRALPPRTDPRRDGLVELGGESAIVRPARLVGAEMARPLRLTRRFRVAHVGVVGHVGGRRFGRFGGGVGHVLGRHLRVFHAHALHLVGIRRPRRPRRTPACGGPLRLSSSSSESWLRSSPISSASSRSCTTSLNCRWSSTRLSSRSRSLPARSSISGRHRSTSLLGGRRRRHAGEPFAHHAAPARPLSERRRGR